MIKKCFIDTETTGLDPQKHGLHQVAAIITDGNGIEIDSIDLKFKPSKKLIEFSALEKTRLTEDELWNRKNSSLTAFSQFIAFLEKHINRFDKKDKLQFIAYNTAFDEAFIREWFTSNGNDFFGAYFWNPTICMQKTAAWFIQNHRTSIHSFKLCNICAFAGIDFNEDEAHDAFYDIRKTLELYHKLS